MSMAWSMVESSFFCKNMCRSGFQSVTEETKSCRRSLPLGSAVTVAICLDLRH